MSQLKQLAVTTRHLNALCDEGSLLIRQVEEFLDEANLGIDATVQYACGPHNDTHVSWFLTYRYVNGRYGIYVCKDIRQGGKLVEWYVTPWCSLSRPVRIDAIRHLPKLLAALNARASQLLEDARHSVVGARGAVSEFIRQSI